MKTTTRLVAAAASIVALIGASPAPVFVDGYTIAMKITTDDANAQGPATITFKVAGDKVRLEMDMAGIAPGGGRGGRRGGRGGGGGDMTGAFMLLQADGQVAAIIPSQQMGITMDIGSISGGRGGGRGGMAGMFGQRTFSDVSVTVDEMGGGESILGHATHKYRVHTKYTETMNTMGNAQTTAHDNTTDLWLATDLADAAQAFARLGAFFSRAGGPEARDALMAKLPKGGFPLKSITTEKTERGTTTATMEATEVKKTSFDDADFEVPPGIQVMDLGAMMRGRGGL